MMDISGLHFLLSLAATSSASPAGNIDIQDLWNSTPLVRGDVFVEFRCGGRSPNAARKKINSRYGKRLEKIEVAMGAPQAKEILPIGKGCPYYAGSAKRYDRLLDQIEHRLRNK
jgi:hypothetical protein